MGFLVLTNMRNEVRKKLVLFLVLLGTSKSEVSIILVFMETLKFT
jgi:hypothetical protein